MMFIEIEGPLDELRSLVGIDGLELARGVKNLGGGRHLARAYVTSKAALSEVQSRKGLTVRITHDEEEVHKRVRSDKDMMKPAFRKDAGPDQEEKKDGGDEGGGSGPRKP